MYIRGKRRSKSDEDARTLGMGMGASLVDLASVSPSRFLIRTERSITSRSIDGGHVSKSRLVCARGAMRRLCVARRR